MASDAKPVRLQLSRRKGFNLQAHSLAVNGLPAAKVDRSTKWGNPFGRSVAIFIGSELVCAREFAMWTDRDTLARNAIAAGVGNESTLNAFELYRLLAPQNVELVAAARAELRGKNTACWCPLPSDGAADICHAAVLLEIANG